MSAKIAAPVPLSVESESGLAAPRLLVSQPKLAALDTLADLEFRIARRADEIAATLPARTDLNLYCWLKAEHEVLAAANFLDDTLAV
jgi:hypothetical protein